MSNSAVRTIALRVSYDGTDFNGWQSQTQAGSDTGRTVQSVIEKALQTVHKHPVELCGSGRTDSGVHAVGQVAHFITDIASMDASRFVPALNSLLPRDVRILDAWQAPDGFHARFDARARTYRFILHCARQAPAHELPYVWHIGRWPDIGRLNSMAALLSGEVDCSTFTAAGDQSHTRSRFFYSAVFFPEGQHLVFELSANAFLWKMVRSITGTLIELEKNDGTAADFKKILHACDRSSAGPTAPPQGLFLWDVRY